MKKMHNKVVTGIGRLAHALVVVDNLLCRYKTLFSLMMIFLNFLIWESQKKTFRLVFVSLSVVFRDLDLLFITFWSVHFSESLRDESARGLRAVQMPPSSRPRCAVGPLVCFRCGKVGHIRGLRHLRPGVKKREARIHAAALVSFSCSSAEEERTDSLHRNLVCMALSIRAISSLCPYRNFLILHTDFQVLVNSGSARSLISSPFLTLVSSNAMRNCVLFAGKLPFHLLPFI